VGSVANSQRLNEGGGLWNSKGYSLPFPSDLGRISIDAQENFSSVTPGNGAFLCIFRTKLAPYVEIGGGAKNQSRGLSPLATSFTLIAAAFPSISRWGEGYGSRLEKIVNSVTPWKWWILVNFLY